MNFRLTEDQVALKELAHKAAHQYLSKIVEEDEEKGRFRPEIIEEFGNLGLCGIPTPTQYGGAGLGYLEYALALEEISAIAAAYAVSISVSGLTQVILNLFGNNEQRQKYIPALARGTHIGSFALTESGSGSDAASLKTRAEKRGQEYIINGTKLFITQANLAHTLIVFARTGKEGPDGISAFILEKNMPGIRIGKTEKKMGCNISPTCEVILENVKVSEKNLVGKEGDGFTIAMAALDSGRITIGATANGLSRAAFEFATRFARERKQFDLPIIEFQGIQFMLADMYTLLEASRLLVLQAANLKDSNLEFTCQASAAKLFSTDACMQITTNAVQILGGSGYMKDFPVERYMREAKVLQIVEGTNQIQRTIIGRSLQN